MSFLQDWVNKLRGFIVSSGGELSDLLMTHEHNRNIQLELHSKSLLIDDV